MIRKLRAQMMPPAGAKRPEGSALADMATAFEVRIDAEAERVPTPGSRSFLRLNRAEYARAVKDLLALDIDVTALLPADTISDGFDNVADAQTFSPALMESYLRAAGKVAALALGDRDAQASEAHYRVPKTASQLQRVEGAPFGTRGGLSVMHTFPADGEYVFRVDLHGNACGFLFGAASFEEQIEVSVDGERRALLAIDPKMYEGTTSLNIKSPPIHVPAGAHRVTAAFLQKFEGPVNDLIAPIDHTLADTQIGVAYGITTMPHLKDLAIAGPTRVTGISDTESRRAVFTCRPTSTRNEQDCATEIVRRVATKAFRRPPSRCRLRRPDGLLPERPRRARLRGRHRRGARSDPGQPAVPVPTRGHADLRQGGQPPTSCATSIWRRACPSSSGAPGPTRRWRRLPARAG